MSLGFRFRDSHTRLTTESSAPNRHFSVFTYGMAMAHEGDELLFIFLPNYSTGLSLFEASRVSGLTTHPFYPF